MVLHLMYRLLKGLSHESFYLCFFSSNISPWASIFYTKSIRIWIQIHRDIRTRNWLCGVTAEQKIIFEGNLRFKLKPDRIGIVRFTLVWIFYDFPFKVNESFQNFLKLTLRWLWWQEAATCLGEFATVCGNILGCGSVTLEKVFDENNQSLKIL